MMTMAPPRWTLLLLSLSACGNLLAGEITVFAAASLTDALKEIAAGYEKTSGEKLVFNFAASNTLAQQIQAGAPADIFFSADEAKMNTLATAGLIVKDTRKDLLGNTLVVITPEKGMKISKAGDLMNAAIKHFSIGDPKAVPAGVYAKAWLESVGLWSSLEPKIVPAENVRAAMAVVESGNAEAGIVYKTDANQSKKVRIALDIPAAEGPKIIYPAAVVSDSRNKEAARKFLSYLAGKQADETFAKFGFSVID
jgi:molybdate transport system substrate-binding protein